MAKNRRCKIGINLTINSKEREFIEDTYKHMSYDLRTEVIVNAIRQYGMDRMAKLEKMKEENQEFFSGKY